MIRERLPPPDSRLAVFLDVDGTLLELAPTPGAVHVPPALPGDLHRAATALDHALAIVSGRPLAEIDALLAWQPLPAAGVHGLELRGPDGSVARDAHAAHAIAAARPALAAVAGGGVLLEDKGVALAVHFRLAPAREAEVDAAVRAAAAASGGVLEALAGSMVRELRPRAATKGDALARLHDLPPFRGRTPVAVGDDVTDEDMFAAALDRGGIAVRVGAGRATPPADVRAWVAALGAVGGGGREA